MNWVSAMSVAATDVSDADLVARSVAGDREAFGRIVERYQNLVCSVTYNGTGSIAQSEDLAQETFIAAWKQVGHLREPSKLRSWLCGIARNVVNNARRRLGREPAHAAESLDVISEAVSAEPLPSDLALSREREAILWGALARIPETYREPLVLFYREHRSIERVAADLELSEDAVKQRLSRGRKLLQDQVAAFVEGALKQSAPGPVFTAGVVGALPMVTLPTAAAGTLGSAMSKTLVGAKLAAWAGVVLGPLLGLAGAWAGYKTGLESTRTPAERDYLRRQMIMLMMGAVAFAASIAAVVFATARWWHGSPMVPVLATVGLIGLNTTWLAIAIMRLRRGFTRLRVQEKERHPELFADGEQVSPSGAGPYRSRASFLGVPLLAAGFGASMDGRYRPVVGWIAFGDVAVGLVAAVGAVAIAPVAIGAVGLGALAAGGIALGGLAFGGVAVGWIALGGVALGWMAASGGLAVAHDFAVGGKSLAANVGDAAETFFAGHRWLDARQPLAQMLIHLCWVPGVVLASLVAWKRWGRQRSQLPPTG